MFHLKYMHMFFKQLIFCGWGAASKFSTDNKVLKFTSSYNNDMILLLQNKLELKLHKILHRYICVFCMCTFVSIYDDIFLSI